MSEEFQMIASKDLVLPIRKWVIVWLGDKKRAAQADNIFRWLFLNDCDLKMPRKELPRNTRKPVQLNVDIVPIHGAPTCRAMALKDRHS
jgi:hypothetical protein